MALGQVLLRVLQFFTIIIPPWLSNLRDEQQARLWPQFRDIVSPDRQEKHEKFIKEYKFILIECDSYGTNEYGDQSLIIENRNLSCSHHFVHAGSAAHPYSYPMCTEGFPPRR
jgi:hypothetical protein